MQMPWASSRYMGGSWPKHVLGVMEMVWAAVLSLQVGYNQSLVLSLLLEQEQLISELITKTNKQKPAGPWHLFLRSKRQVTEAENTSADREIQISMGKKKYNCQRAMLLRLESNSWSRVSGPGAVALSDHPSVISYYEEAFAIAIHSCGF